MPTKKHYKNRLLTQVGRAVADLRIFIEYAETGEFPDEAGEAQVIVDSLISLNNMVEQI
jgi:hypothetical protein